MAHTHEAAGGTRFLHNGDYSGDVSLVVPEAAAHLHDAEGCYPARWEVRVPFADLRELVLSYLRQRRIERAELATDDEFERDLLGGGLT
jgi:hypothetical protein